MIINISFFGKQFWKPISKLKKKDFPIVCKRQDGEFEVPQGILDVEFNLSQSNFFEEWKFTHYKSI